MFWKKGIEIIQTYEKAASVLFRHVNNYYKNCVETDEKPDSDTIIKDLDTYNKLFNLIENPPLYGMLTYEKSETVRETLKSIRSLLDKLYTNCQLSEDISAKIQLLEKLDDLIKCYDKNKYKGTKADCAKAIIAELTSFYQLLNLESMEYSGYQIEKGIHGHSVEGRILYGSVSNKQISEFSRCIYCCSVNEFISAVYCFYDFLDNNHININKPISNFEKIAIKIMIESIQRVAG